MTSEALTIKCITTVYCMGQIMAVIELTTDGSNLDRLQNTLARARLELESSFRNGVQKSRKIKLSSSSSITIRTIRAVPFGARLQKQRKRFGEESTFTFSSKIKKSAAFTKFFSNQPLLHEYKQKYNRERRRIKDNEKCAPFSTTVMLESPSPTQFP